MKTLEKSFILLALVTGLSPVKDTVEASTMASETAGEPRIIRIEAEPVSFTRETRSEPGRAIRKPDDSRREALRRSPGRESNPARVGKVPLPPAVARELESLKRAERVAYQALRGARSPEHLFRLGRVRFDEAVLKHKNGLLSDSTFRRALQKRILPPLRLNLRAWASGEGGDDWSARDASGWQRKTLGLLEKVMRAVKMTVKNVPSRSLKQRRKTDVVGRASWYGGEVVLLGKGVKTHHGPTAKGDTFCMFGQTCAYWKAPLGSWVRVKNLRNGRWMDLRVNDTGGFHKYGKVIDLSRGAYAHLQVYDNEQVIIRRIKSEEAIREPILCDGKGHFDAKLHLDRTHAAIPREWKKYLE